MGLRWGWGGKGEWGGGKLVGAGGEGFIGRCGGIGKRVGGLVGVEEGRLGRG